MKHPKQCTSTYVFRNPSGSTSLIRCQKHLRHKTREHQFYNIRWWPEPLSVDARSGETA